MGSIFSSPIDKISKANTPTNSPPEGNCVTKCFEDPRSPTIEVKRTPLQDIQQNSTQLTTINQSSDTPIIRKDTVTLRRKLFDKLHASSSKGDKTN
uniref:Uncharacterized protein n=1 Tax=Strongyloides venezuelensis TaxID=75913 RepID=A0A0K0FG70_STRVS